MTHVELSGDVWRGDNDGVGLLLRVYLSVEVALFLPVMVDTVLEFLRGVGLCKFLSHCNVVLSFSDIFGYIYAFALLAFSELTRFSSGVTYSVRLFVNITMPGFAPAGFLTNFTAT